MEQYKRNQVEEAIAAALQQADQELVPDLRIRLKRLLDTDYALSRTLSGPASEQAFAFSTGERPGRGVEVWFSAYEAFALLLGALLLQHRWPQQTAVRIMRQARPRLEPEHARLLSLDAAALFEGREHQAAPGSMAHGSTDPVFLAIVSSSFSARIGPETLPLAVEVCRGEATLMQLRRERAPAGSSMTILELTGSAHMLAFCLRQTKPRTRGRSSR